MKKVLFYAVFACSIMFVISCSKSDKELVKKTGEKFMTALISRDSVTVNSLVTPETAQKWKGSFDLVLSPELLTRLSSVQTQVSDVVVNGEEAQAIIAVAIPSEIGEVTTLNFKKVNGKWLVNQPGILVKEVVEEETVIIDVDAAEVRPR